MAKSAKSAKPAKVVKIAKLPKRAKKAKAKPVATSDAAILDRLWATVHSRKGADPAISHSARLLARGQERYDIFCAPCHGYDGRGQGVVPQRVAAMGGNWQARNLVEPGGVAVQMPNGQLFNTISNGYNTMMGYAAQIPHADRWAIVLYVRALQRGQNAALDDAPDQLQDAR